MTPRVPRRSASRGRASLERARRERGNARFRRRPRAAARRAGARRRDLRPSALRKGAERRLSRYRRGSALAVALTGFALLALGGPDASPEGGDAETTSVSASLLGLVPQEPPPGGQDATTAEAQDTVAGEALAQDTAALEDPGRAVSEATGTLRSLARDTYAFLPKLAIALVLLLLAGGLVRLVKLALRRVLGSWERADAAAAMAGVFLWLLALGTALSILVGDPRALVGSVGLFGLALSWALQVPIESFTGWLMNSFRGYYRIGDRIAVGEVFGDVAQIDFLTTTVWEAGGPDKPVQGAQATGALITFPNSEVLRSNIVNYTRDFPYVWDELTVGVTNESDLAYALELVRRVADEVVGGSVAAAAEEYARLLRRAGLAHEAATRPEVYASPADAWTDVTVRYAVPARERRRWSSEIFAAVTRALAAPENRERVTAAVPRQRVDLTHRPAGGRESGGSPAASR